MAGRLSFQKISRDRRVVMAILIGLSFLVYFNSLGGAFVVDDVVILRDPRMTQPLAFLKTGEPVGLTFSLNYFLGQSQPFFYHLTNVLIHLGVVILTYFFLLQITNQEVAFLATAIFAVHPLNSEAVSWISGRPYSLGALFLLASLLLYLLGHQKKRFFYYYYLGSLITFLLGAVANNKLLIGSFIFVFYELLFGKITKRWQKLVPYFLLTLLFLVWLVKPFQSRATVADYSGEIIFYNPLKQIPSVIGTYLELFVLPLNLTFYHHDFLAHYWLKIGLTFVLLLGLVYCYRKQKILFFGFSVFILSLLPTLLPIKIANLVAERYAYFGLIGLCLVVAWILVKALRKYSQILLLASSLILLLLSARTMVRNQDWRTKETLWLATVRASPTSATAWNNLGIVYSEKGNYQASIRAFQRALELNPNYAEAYHNFGVTYFKTGNYDEAIELFKKVVNLNPNPRVYKDLGVAFFQKEDYQKAEEQYRKAIELDPKSVLIHNLLGLALFNQRKFNQAREIWEKALELDPNNEEIKNNLRLLP